MQVSLSEEDKRKTRQRSLNKTQSGDLDGKGTGKALN